MNGKSIVITGATGGIGVALAKEFNSKGANLVLVARNEDKLRSLNDILGGKHKIFVWDLADVSGYREKAEWFMKSIERVDILVNNAGVGYYKHIEELNLDEWNDSLAINTTSAFFITKSLINHLRNAEPGVVINIGSGMGIMPKEGRAAYCASKFALRGLSLALSKEYANKGVKFIHLALGSTLTEFGPLTIEDKKKLGSEGKRYLMPEEVSKKISEIIANGEYPDEIEFYPLDYKR